MGQFSAEISSFPGSFLGGNQHISLIQPHQLRVEAGSGLEEAKAEFWSRYKFLGGVTTIFTTHAIIQSWQESHFTRLWFHPKFDPEDPAPQIELRDSFVIAEVVFDELEVDEFTNILPEKLFRKIERLQEAYPDWKTMARANRVCVYADVDLGGIESFDQFDRLMRLNLNEFDEVKVNFSEIPFGHGEDKNLYRRQNGHTFHLGNREWPFGNFRIGFLTTEMLTASVVEKVFKMRTARERAKVKANQFSLGQKGSHCYTEDVSTTRSPRWNLTPLHVPDPPLLFPNKIPFFLDSRARADRRQKVGITQLAKEILDANPNAVVIANGTKGSVEGVQTFQSCKGKNDLIDKDIYIVATHLAPDQYAELNVIGQWLGIPNILNLFYMDQINQAVGRNRGFRESKCRQTKTVLVTSKRLFDSVISKCCSEEGSRTALYEIYEKPW